MGKFQLTHPSRGATWGVWARNAGRKNFNSHTPRGVRPNFLPEDIIIPKFQLTHPSRGATSLVAGFIGLCPDFNSHTPRGVRLNGVCE